MTAKTDKIDELDKLTDRADQLIRNHNLAAVYPEQINRLDKMLGALQDFTRALNEATQGSLSERNVTTTDIKEDDIIPFINEFKTSVDTLEEANQELEQKQNLSNTDNSPEAANKKYCDKLDITLNKMNDIKDLLEDKANLKKDNQEDHDAGPSGPRM